MTKALLCTLALATGLVSGPDMGIRRLAVRKNWADRSDIYVLPSMDEEGKCYLQFTLIFEATESLRVDHACDVKRKPVPHVHILDDYSSTSDGNRFWESKYDCPRMAERIRDVTVALNGMAVILQKMAAGEVRCWVNRPEIVEDLLLSKMTAMQSGQSVTTGGSMSAADSTPSHGLSWKRGPSGTYQALRNAADMAEIETMTVESSGR